MIGKVVVTEAPAPPLPPLVPPFFPPPPPPPPDMVTDTESVPAGTFAVAQEPQVGPVLQEAAVLVVAAPATLGAMAEVTTEETEARERIERTSEATRATEARARRRGRTCPVAGRERSTGMATEVLPSGRLVMPARSREVLLTMWFLLQRSPSGRAREPGCGYRPLVGTQGRKTLSLIFGCHPAPLNRKQAFPLT